MPTSNPFGNAPKPFKPTPEQIVAYGRLARAIFLKPLRRPRPEQNMLGETEKQEAELKAAQAVHTHSPPVVKPGTSAPDQTPRSNP